MKSSLLLLPLVLSGVLSAQSTIRVNGPDLAKAIQNAKAGDILLVSGTFGASPLVIDKPLFIHGAGPVLARISWSNVLIKSIPAGRSLVFQGFRLDFGASIRVEDCPGQVLLSQILPGRHAARVSAKNCADLSMTECDIGSPIVLENCTTSVYQSSAIGGYSPGSTDSPAITVIRGSLSATDVSAQGGYGGSGSPASGIQLDRAHLDVNGVSKIDGGLNAAQTRGPAVGGSGTVSFDASTKFTGSKSFGTGVTGKARAIPVTAMNATAIGGTAKIRVRAQPGLLYGLFVGTPGAPVSIPGFGGTLSVSQPLLILLGTIPVTGATELSFTVPNVPQLRAQIFRWQSATVDKGAGQWGNPLTECHF